MHTVGTINSASLVIPNPLGHLFDDLFYDRLKLLLFSMNCTGICFAEVIVSPLSYEESVT